MNLERLTQTLHELSRRPGHEGVRVRLYQILTERLEANSADIRLEQQVPEVRGRIDALVGRTVVEIKSDLRREIADAEAQLVRYLPEREQATGLSYVGLATDGADFIAYEYRDGALRELTRRRNKPSEARDTAVWLESVFAVRDRLPAEAISIIENLGRDSAAFARASGRLQQAWDVVGMQPEPQLKRQLWEQHLALVYGTDKTSDALWLRHTYLVCVAKAIAAAAMGLPITDAADLLSGRSFRSAGIMGAVESDFFDWILDAPAGPEIVRRITDHAGRFELASIDVDLLKILYESLIDPEDRHDLGEYYTPDWLADLVTRQALGDGIDARVLDPSCGSGTFLFHAIRRKRQGMEAAGVPSGEIAARCTRTVHGLDVHPVAVIFARVTVLLALGPALANRSGPLSVPVYMGNAMQWDVRPDEGDLVVHVPAASEGGPRAMLRFPLEVCALGDQLESILAEMQRGSELNEGPRAFANRLDRLGVATTARETLTETYRIFDALNREGRNHIWGYMVRNLARPIALSAAPKMDVILGNPPWLSYRYMSTDLKARFRDGCRAINVWVREGRNADNEAHLVTQTDLSGYFFARSTELYLNRGGQIAMVLPLAAMTRGQFRAFRTGRWTQTRVRFTDAWVLDNQDIVPLFRVPTCVIFAEKIGAADALNGLPDQVTAFFGRPPTKDASVAELGTRVTARRAHAPAEVSFEGRSPYRSRFKQGATLTPRMMCYVERTEVGRLGGNAAAPVVRSRPSMHKPWCDLDLLQQAVNAEVLRTAYLGSSIAPFRILETPEAVVPVVGTTVLDSQQAESRGLHQTADWLRQCEVLWDRHSARTMKFKARLDYQKGLSEQFPLPPLRLVYAASGVQVAAVLVRDQEAVIEHSLYWCTVASDDEGHYLAALLNSDNVRARIEHMQSRGEQGARHFDKLFFTLPIPRFDSGEVLHMRLAEAGQAAEMAAAQVPIEPETSFITARTAIRAALRDDGTSALVDVLVDELLGDAGLQDRAAPVGDPITFAQLSGQA
ncbi:hypothetical protein E4L95_05325 [Paracoccus liaowanqingii]|uniref:site-specific DNA-methyltransferase (adenine-specific) n=1 Tax=Paracoccus liaowanqingii TaxID=2560053 RepID=A0A4Z1CQH2_9RHOB|nr:N-6 DNA methylase [Paracoccus liaowanqingii]TGN67326.1 hypothetical protein E4L95_05325 [Paracoccus liaowanqingii]